MSLHAGCNSVTPTVFGLPHVSWPPQHLLAIVVQMSDDGLGVCPV